MKLVNKLSVFSVLATCTRATQSTDDHICVLSERSSNNSPFVWHCTLHVGGQTAPSSASQPCQTKHLDGSKPSSFGIQQSFQIIPPFNLQNLCYRTGYLCHGCRDVADRLDLRCGREISNIGCRNLKKRILNSHSM